MVLVGVANTEMRFAGGHLMGVANANIRVGGRGYIRILAFDGRDPVGAWCSGGRGQSKAEILSQVWMGAKLLGKKMGLKGSRVTGVKGFGPRNGRMWGLEIWPNRLLPACNPHPWHTAHTSLASPEHHQE